MKTLGISCAGPIIGVAVTDEERSLGEVVLDNPRSSEKIPALAQQLLQELGIALDQIDLISVTQGPGSYSGLRGGLAAAKTIAQAREIALVGVSSLESIAANLQTDSGVIVALLHALRDQWNIALFARQDVGLHRLTDDFVITEEALNRWASGVSAPLLWSKDNASPSAVARLGFLKFRAGQRDDPLKLLPYYSHQPVYRKFAMMNA